jgi:hypothetical protein
MTTMRTLLRLSAPSSLACALALVAGIAIAGEPATPLGKWMKPNVGAPLAEQDFATLAKSLALVGSKPPPGTAYPKWAEISNAGAAAAGKQDLAGVKASCKKCHDLYKESYKKDFATRAFP